MTTAVTAQELTPRHYDSMRWRMIGPFRGGRTVGAVGVPGQPSLFYIGVNNGGVWKTNDYGRTWHPIFDDQPTGSIGAVAVARSKPDVLYVGSGEGLQRPDLSVGDGVYKSTNGGKTWRHMGLADAQQIPAIQVDPRDPDRVFVAVLGHPYGANAERGVFRSTDGGKSWEKVLYKDENTGAVALEFDPSDPRTIYAALWSSRQGPWENGSWQGATSGLYKSTDGGTQWRPLTNGLPTANEGLGRIGIGVCPADPKCVFAMVDAGAGNAASGGLYRSDDAGESWRLINGDKRLWGRGSDFAEVKVDPKNKDVLYVANTCAYRSTDGGKTFLPFKGAPGGDDPHTFWINPDNPQIILLAGDQGACVTVNGGQTWSSWYNQPTAQFYHVITDNRFPYWVYGAQQESGSAGVASRGKDGQITFRDWHPVGVEEYGYVAPDPLNPRFIYGGKVSRYDMATGEVTNVGPPGVGKKGLGKGKAMDGGYRTLRTAPLLFSTVDPHVLFFGANVLFKTTDGGAKWEVISPDLSRESPDVPENIGIFRTPALAKQARRGVIYTVAPSYKDINVIWCGTDDGLIHVTSDGGKNWRDVTPPGVTAWSKLSLMDAGRFDAQTAYAAVNRIRLDDQRPHIYRTRDGGKTWQEIVKGLPEVPVNVIREDPIRRGLLFCGTERAVFVSFNDGDDWQPLRLNMPATSVRDLVIHEDDVVVGTHGRSFWILDDITPLQQLDAKIVAAPFHLFKPQGAYRVQWNLNTDTPLPPEEPGGKNPPDGAVINYYLKKAAAGPVTLEIFDARDNLVRRYSSEDVPAKVDESKLTIPSYWLRTPQILSARAGSHRFIWDLRYPPTPGKKSAGNPMAAIYRDTPGPQGPMVPAGEYTVKLSVDGQCQVQSLTVKMDPRLKTPPEPAPPTRKVSMRTVDLDIGETQHVAMGNGRKTSVKLISLNETRDVLRDAVRRAEVVVEIDGKPTTLVSANYRLPVTAGAVQIDCPVTKGYRRNATKGVAGENPWGLDKDARIRLWPAAEPLLEPGTFLYPAKQRWFASGTQMANEPVHVDGGENPLVKNIYYHYGLDIGGAEELVEVVAATDGIVVSSGKLLLKGHEGTPAKPRYDVVYLLDERGWYYRYSHLHTIANSIKPGARVKRGQLVGLLGKEGGSGGWSHLHFDITGKQPSGKWGIIEGYAFLWEAYQRKYQPRLLAVARPHHLAAVGEIVTLDGSRSWSKDGKISAYDWSFTDGRAAKGATVERSYAKPGVYSEILKITDGSGRIDYDFAVVNVLAKDQPDKLPPSIHVVYYPTFGIKSNDPVTFLVRTFRTTDGKESWDFGDGSDRVEVQSDGNVVPLAKDGYARTVHRFAKAGHYVVRVERTNHHGHTAIAHLQVRVGED